MVNDNQRENEVGLPRFPIVPVCVFFPVQVTSILSYYDTLMKIHSVIFLLHDFIIKLHVQKSSMSFICPNLYVNQKSK